MQTSVNIFLKQLKLRYRELTEFPLKVFSYFLWPFISIIPMYFAVTLMPRFEQSGYTVLTFVLYLLFARLTTYSNSIMDAGPIISGDITKIIVRPISYSFYTISSSFSNNIILISFSLFLLLISGLYFIGIKSLLAFPFLILSYLITVYIYYMIHLTAFFIGENWGVTHGLNITIGLLSGYYIPIDLFPKFMQTIISYTPLDLISYVPAKIYIDQFPITYLLVLKYIFWIIILYFASVYLTKISFRRYEQLGG